MAPTCDAVTEDSHIFSREGMMSLVIRHPPFSHFIAFLALLHRCLLSPTTTVPCDLVRDRCDLLRSHRDPTQPPRDLRLFVAALAPFGNPG